MGRDLEEFVHPERISSQLICPICTQVLLNPVQTATEHLFCEDELLEWMTRSSQCPVTKRTIDPGEIRRPGRIVLNMLAELEVFCCYKRLGCPWTGPQELLASHSAHCAHRPVTEFVAEIEEKNGAIARLEARVEDLERENRDLEEKCLSALQEIDALKSQLVECHQRLRLYDALLPTANVGAMPRTGKAEEAKSDADRLRRLSTLGTLDASKRK